MFGKGCVWSGEGNILNMFECWLKVPLWERREDIEEEQWERAGRMTPYRGRVGWNLAQEEILVFFMWGSSQL